MRPSDLYAMPTLSEEDWNRSSAVAVMFGRRFAYRSDVEASALPLKVVTKVAVDDLDGIHDEDVTWRVMTWEGRPFGVVVGAGEEGQRFVTDTGLHRHALLGLVGLAPPEVSQDVVAPDAVLMALAAAGGHVLVRNDGGVVTPVPRYLCPRGTPLIDVSGLKARLASVPGYVEDARPIGLGALGDMVLASVPPGLRTTLHYDQLAVLGRLPSLGRGWLGPLVATDESTYLLCVRESGMQRPLDAAICGMRLGSPSVIDELATGAIIGPDERETLPRP